MAIYWQDERLVVEQILDRWRSPEGKSYRIRTRDRQIFELHYSETNDAWRIVQR